MELLHQMPQRRGNRNHLRGRRNHIERSNRTGAGYLDKLEKKERSTRWLRAMAVKIPIQKLRVTRSVGQYRWRNRKRKTLEGKNATNTPGIEGRRCDDKGRSLPLSGPESSFDGENISEQKHKKRSDRGLSCS